MYIKKTLTGALIGLGLIAFPAMTAIPASAETVTSVPAPTGLKTTGQTISAVALTWSPVPNAGQYRVVVSKTPDMANATFARSNGTANTLEIRGLDSGTDYYFKVRVLDAAGNNLSSYSPAITVKTLPPRAVLPPVAQPLSVASYNIKCANCSAAGELSWNDRKAAVVSAIKNANPDIIGIQEASQGWLKDASGKQIDLSQFEDLRNGLNANGGTYAITNDKRNNCENDRTPTNCVYKDQGASQGTRIFYNTSKVSLDAAGSKVLPGISAENNTRYMAWGQFTQKSTGKKVFFVDTHLEPADGPAYYDLRKKQAETIVAEIKAKNTANLPVVVTGDMNSSKWATPTNAPYDVFTSAGYLDPLGNTYASNYPSGTGAAETVINANYNSFNGYVAHNSAQKPVGQYGSHIDYIFTSKMRVPEWKMALNLDANGDLAGIIPSDHNMLTAKLELPGTAVTKTALTIKGESLKGSLGAKVGGEVYNTAKTSGYQRYEKGYVVWSSTTGAWVSSGAIRSRWAISGYESGFLGFPTGDEVKTAGGSYQKYQKGYILWNAVAGAHTSMGPIRSAFAREGYESGRLGYPTGEIIKNSTTGGSYQRYQHGYILESPTTGAHISQGLIRSAWAKTGYETGTLGYPTTDEYPVTGGIAQKFQKGTITVNTATGTAKVTYN
jgi:endonuclease/exonuclease/phosphatase family metal-dependent hydrolase